MQQAAPTAVVISAAHRALDRVGGIALGQPAVRARTRLAAFWATWRGSILTALLGVAVFRVATLLLATAVAYHGAAWGLLLHHPVDALLQPWWQYDATWWAGIAQNGYGALSVGPYSDGAFAPAYPMAMRGAMWLLHIGPLAGGFVVSTVSLLVAVAVVHRLIEEGDGPGAARTGVLLLLAWPTAVFLAAPYSESMSLALVALTLLAARRERWLWAGTLAALAMLSKYVLGLLVIALVIDHMVRQRRRGERLQARALLSIATPGAVALAGVLLFMRARFGDPLFFLAAEGNAWGHRLAAPWQLAANAWRELDSLAHLGGLAQLRAFFIDDVTILGLAALAGFMLWRRRRHPAEAALVSLIAATFLCMSGPDSVSRYALAVAPIFVVLGAALHRRPRHRAVVIACSAAVMVLQLVTYAGHGWAG